MAWNEPGGSGDKDPWGQNSKKGGEQGPPDLDEIIANLQKKVGAFFGGKKGGGSGSGGDSNSGGLALGGLGIIGGVALIGWFLSGFYIVEEGYRAVVLQFGKYDDTTPPGLHWYPRGIQSIEKVDVSGIRSAKIGYQSEEALMLTQDENMIDIRFDVQYRIKDDPLAARDYLYNVRNPDETLSQATSSAVRSVIGNSKMDFVITEGRGVVALEAQQRLQTILDSYNTGLIVNQLTMQGAQAPSQVKEAFDDVVKAREDSERYKNQAETYSNDVLPQARGQAARIVEEAKAYRDQVIANAEGEADRFVKVLTEYEKAPEVTRERIYLETMEHVLAKSGKIVVDVEGGNNMLYLPLDRIVNRTSEPVVSRPPEINQGLVQRNLPRSGGNMTRESLRGREVR